MRDETRPVRLEEYRPPDYTAETTELDFHLDPHQTRVAARTRFRRRAVDPAALRLDCGALAIEKLLLDGVPLAPSRLQRREGALILLDPPERFTLEVVTLLNPEANTALEGLYMSGGRFCTQCEAEGFRSITPALDRPDVMARYSVRIEADRARYPLLLSNGERVAAGELEGGRHYAQWRDPHPKPSYLFALVAGAFDSLEDRFLTRSGRSVALGVHVDQGDAPKARYALDALKRAMRWDEEVFGREYDLDVFNLVAVRDFNFGAMENKGLNIFNSAYVLADSETATDADFEAIESVVAHEYFHNWTGNRITLRDWFQLCLKEGLTVFRDQEFSASQRSRGVQRIKDVKRLRQRQFVEDAGPLAHPVRPTSYLKIDNFYTATVYEKGAEIVRLLQTLLGPERFAAGMQRYFESCDGTAATIEDFLAAFEEAAGQDLSAFARWYRQVGPTRLRQTTRFDPDTSETLLRVERTPASGGAALHPPMPLRVGFLAQEGAALALQEVASGKTAAEHLLTLEGAAGEWRFLGAQARPVTAVLRGFSAPAILEDDLSEAELFVQLGHDPDPFTRWDAGQRLAKRLILAGAATPGWAAAMERYARALQPQLSAEDKALAALLLRAPDLSDLMQEEAEPDPDRLLAGRNALRRAMAETLGGDLKALLSQPEPSPANPSGEQAGERALRSVALDLLAALPDHGGFLLRQFAQAHTMSLRLGALEALGAQGGPEFEQALAAFYQRFQGDPLVLDKWFAVQAGAARADALARVEALQRHEAFELGNPNRVRALALSFAQRNLAAFHAADGGGYRFLARIAMLADARNPSLGARLLAPFESWRRMDAARRSAAEAVLRGLQSRTEISKNAREIVTRMLGELG